MSGTFVKKPRHKWSVSVLGKLSCEKDPQSREGLCVMRRCVHISTCNMLYFCAIIHNSICFYFTAILSGHAPVQCGENNSVLKPKNTQQIGNLRLKTHDKKNHIQSSIESKNAKFWMSTLIRVFERVHKLLSLCQRAGGQRSTVGLNFNGFWLRRMYVHNLGL